ncbi:hypothetical protein AKJ45_02825 [candidate division MSBL1 archaeon SCGC-AAA261F19]|uniref:Uncharacterized protein n=1 Tax=candidate division MSBL1 archaeon SCGC-AAA261F19 TaxID=1698275 RepID=A0A133V997_9EURY|nr:hypothetical protein AKJ45_02825 [candidate division MSBL1 archaeon SCGC-AAA261F19]
MYQGIYRARPGMREIEVYVFGRLPDSIKKEFDAKTIVIDHDRTREVALGLENFVYRILENEWEVKFDTIYERIKEEYHLKNRSAIYTVLNKIAKNNEDVSIGIIKENRVGRPSKSLTIKRIRR